MDYAEKCEMKQMQFILMPKPWQNHLKARQNLMQEKSTCGELSRSRRLRASDLTGPPRSDFWALADEDGVTKRFDRLSWEDEGEGVTAKCTGVVETPRPLSLSL